MLRTLFPKNHRRYEESCCARELDAFGAWLTASGYSRENICGHLRRLRSVLERAGEAGAGTCYSDRRLGELFSLPHAPPARAVNYRATRRAYQRFLVSRGRLDAEPVDGPHERLVEEYAEFLREVRGFASSTTASHRSTVIEFLTHAAEPTHLIGALSVTQVERYLSMKAVEVTRQTLQHTVAHLRAFLRYGFERGLIRERLDRLDTPRAYRGEQPPRAMPCRWYCDCCARSTEQARRAGATARTSWPITACALRRSSHRVDSVDFEQTLRVEQLRCCCRWCCIARRFVMDISVYF